MKIYVVIGESGEYSSREEWVVAAHMDEEIAKWHVVLAAKRAAEIEFNRRRKIFTGSDIRNEFDLEMPYCDDNCYRYEETELIE